MTHVHDASSACKPLLLALVWPGRACIAASLHGCVATWLHGCMQILDEPLPENCYAEDHADYDGYAVQWGLGNKARSAKECCQMCKDFKPRPDMPNGCNIWVRPDSNHPAEYRDCMP